jgi:hypothetical protein
MCGDRARTYQRRMNASRSPQKWWDAPCVTAHGTLGEPSSAAVNPSRRGGGASSARGGNAGGAIVTVSGAFVVNSTHSPSTNEAMNGETHLDDQGMDWSGSDGKTGAPVVGSPSPLQSPIDLLGVTDVSLAEAKVPPFFPSFFHSL